MRYVQCGGRGRSITSFSVCDSILLTAYMLGVEIIVTEWTKVTCLVWL